MTDSVGVFNGSSFSSSEYYFGMCSPGSFLGFGFTISSEK
jgi:hypothetical protein